MRCIEADIEGRNDGCELFIIQQVSIFQVRVVVGRSSQNCAERLGIVDGKHRLQNGTPSFTVKCFDQELGLRHGILMTFSLMKPIIPLMGRRRCGRRQIAFGIVKFSATGPMSTDWTMRRGSLLQKIPPFSLIQIKVGVSQNGKKKSRWPAINAREVTP